MVVSRKPSVSALRNLIDPKHRGKAMDAHHRLVWTAFADDPDRRRDFLWRHDANGVFFVLSEREPERSPFFEDICCKPFQPVLRAGDDLDFVVRVNATRSTPVDSKDVGHNGKPKRRRHDLVMHAIYQKDNRKEHRMPAARAVASSWLTTQGEAKGFVPYRVNVQDYSVMALPHHFGRRKGQPQFGILELSGRLEVKEPEAFIGALRSGFGRAKAFGCGLMLIKRP